MYPPTIGGGKGTSAEAESGLQTGENLLLQKKY